MRKSWNLLLVLFCFVFLLITFFFLTVFICSPGKPGTHRELPASVSQMLGLKACTTRASTLQFILKKKRNELGAGSGLASNINFFMENSQVIGEDCVFNV